MRPRWNCRCWMWCPMSNTWPPPKPPADGPQWALEGSKCRARGCGTLRRAWALVPYLVSDGSPQGEWLCESGHRGWISADDCTKGTK